MTTIVDLIKFEEGFRSRPYLCSEGYPTVGYGFKLGPMLSGPHSNGLATCQIHYDFELPQAAADAWLTSILNRNDDAMLANPVIGPALAHLFDAYDLPRAAVLQSMAYQMGIKGLASFKRTLTFISEGLYVDAAEYMLQSKWARQTPARAKRHSKQMSTGQWAEEYGK